MSTVVPFAKPYAFEPGLRRVYLDCPPTMSKGIGRVVSALKAHLPPGVQVVDQRELADLVVFHVVGVQNFEEVDLPTLIAECVGRGQRYAMIQYCLRTTEQPTPAFWYPLWHGAACVWSYYDLLWFLQEDQRLDVGTMWAALGTTFYYAPLGVDQAVFNNTEHAEKLYTIGTSGYVAETEGVLEASAAVKAVGGWHFHLGPNFHLGRQCDSAMGLSDTQVARRWRECLYVAGLRRVEGFELPAVEGLLCGARPVMFGAPHYRQWFGDLAEYVPEGTAEEVTEALTDLFSRPYRSVTTTEIEQAKQRFDWATLCSGFWERVL